MENVPKIVRERLAAAPRVAHHPDANVLTAFAEHSLPSGERTVVLEHLAHCADCRDVVALALPETDAATLLPRPARGGWLTWPALRWGLVTAGVVIVAAFGILQYQHREQNATIAKQEAPRLEPPAAKAASQPAAEGAAPVPVANSREGKAELDKFADSASGTNAIMVLPKGMARAKTPSAPAQDKSLPSTVGGPINGLSPRVPLHSGPAVANQWQQNSQNAYQLQNSNSAIPPSAAPQRDLDVAHVETPAPQAFEVRGQASSAGVGAGASAGIPPNQIHGSLPSTAAPASAKAAPPVPAGARLADQAAQEEARLRQKAVPGQMAGYVVDPSGVAIPNTRITVSSAGGTTSAVTDSAGHWQIAGLPSGNYKARAEASGFQTLARDFNYDASQPSLYVFPLSVGTVSETVEVAAQSPQVETESTAAGAVVRKEVSQLPLNGRNASQLVALSPGVVPSGVIPRWSINSAGGLERSVDQGKTWQDVSLVVASTSSYDMALVAKNAAVTKEKADKKARAWRSAKSAAVVFRAVAANGADVWAGASGGLLYHSLDAGNTWAQVTPTSAGSTLTGDILTLEFPDPQQGKITTSNSEVWTTADSGRTWQKQ